MPTANYSKGSISLIESASKDAAGSPAWTYNVLSTPSYETYDFLTLHEMPEDFTGKSDGYRYFHGYISAKEIQNKKFPLDSNPRKPSPTTVTKSMQATLSKFGEEFHHWNNGITLICESVTLEANGSYKIEFGKQIEQHGYGIVNGGHTYYSIEQSKIKFSDSVAVRIELVILPPSFTDAERERAIKQIAMKRNAHNELDTKTEAHYSGAYNNWINALGDFSKHIVWLQGDTNAVADAVSADKFITMVSSVDPYYFNHYQSTANKTHQQCTAGVSPHKRWVAEYAKPLSDHKLEHTILLTDEILQLLHTLGHSLDVDDYKSVSKNIKLTKIWKEMKKIHTDDLKFHPNRTASTKCSGYDLFKHTRWGSLFLGPFRGNVWIARNGKAKRFTGWLIDPQELWELERISFVNQLNNLAAGINGSWVTKFFQDGSPFSYDLAERQLGKANLISALPTRFYEEGVVGRYEKTDNKSIATHTLEIVSTVDNKFSRIELHAGVVSSKNNVAYYIRR